MTLNAVVIFLISFFALWLGSQLGAWIGRREKRESEGLEDFRIILGATLSLLGLLIGFSLSMSIGGFNNRQAGEEMEAASINAAFMRAELLPETQRNTVQNLLIEYLDKRLDFYNQDDPNARREIVHETSELQFEIWTTVSTTAHAQQTPVIALAVTGINDVINSQKKTQASWRNQIPFAAWLLLAAVALFCSMMTGYNSRDQRRSSGIFFILPMTISLSFMMIADIDVPGQGIIRVNSSNLEQLEATVKSRKATQNAVPHPIRLAHLPFG